ncbi:hypothetical protein E2C01_011432 [Portunus trituberculatus]|uniref:Uncharacterized protein n=1 Tax=Portunus trituberculatus TaxID=210409 RepID=A0A5B7DB23_PORTR|nr:hypothetical protein [Portunus trituberculatus]
MRDVTSHFLYTSSGAHDLPPSIEQLVGSLPHCNHCAATLTDFKSKSDSLIVTVPEIRYRLNPSDHTRLYSPPAKKPLPRVRNPNLHLRDLSDPKARMVPLYHDDLVKEVSLSAFGKKQLNGTPRVASLA